MGQKSSNPGKESTDLRQTNSKPSAMGLKSSTSTEQQPKVIQSKTLKDVASSVPVSQKPSVMGQEPSSPGKGSIDPRQTNSKVSEQTPVMRQKHSNQSVSQKPSTMGQKSSNPWKVSTELRGKQTNWRGNTFPASVSQQTPVVGQNKKINQ